MRGEWDKGGMERKCFIDLFYILRQFRGKRYAIYVNYLKNIQKNPLLLLTEQKGRGKIKHLSTADGKTSASYLDRSIAHFPEECKSRAEGF